MNRRNAHHLHEEQARCARRRLPGSQQLQLATHSREKHSADRLVARMQHAHNVLEQADQAGTAPPAPRLAVGSK